MSIFAQWERCAQLCDFEDSNLSTFPSVNEVVEIIAEGETLIAEVQAFCGWYDLKLDHFRE